MISLLCEAICSVKRDNVLSDESKIRVPLRKGVEEWHRRIEKQKRKQVLHVAKIEQCTI